MEGPNHVAEAGGGGDGARGAEESALSVLCHSTRDRRAHAHTRPTLHMTDARSITNLVSEAQQTPTQYSHTEGKARPRPRSEAHLVQQGVPAVEKGGAATTSGASHPLLQHPHAQGIGLSRLDTKPYARFAHANSPPCSQSRRPGALERPPPRPPVVPLSTHTPRARCGQQQERSHDAGGRSGGAAAGGRKKRSEIIATFNVFLVRLRAKMFDANVSGRACV